MPGLDLNEPINWDEIEEFEGDVHDLSYDYVSDSGNGADNGDDDDEGEDGQDEGDHNTVDVVVEPEAGSGAHILQQVEGESVQQVEEADAVPQADAGDLADAVAFDSGTPANIKRRRYYPPDIKRILYAMCLERSAPGMMK
ncbi:unnamed protein product [Miscanthus lutarioriparius]|uniref:Uncharacterized protein n=1 Tax=Miscanthus lutarioriparius TaxID=422564 RepID=A0A811NNE9_9POAL|nr:unnamed protein product [Miscanthus lutarioriparius]